MARSDDSIDKRIAALLKLAQKNEERWKGNEERWERNDQRWEKLWKYVEANEKRWSKNEERWSKNEERWRRFEQESLKRGERIDAMLKVLHRLMEGSGDG